VTVGRGAIGPDVGCDWRFEINGDSKVSKNPFEWKMSNADYNWILPRPKTGAKKLLIYDIMSDVSITRRPLKRVQPS
jgi:hypothetical protein